ncbi:hypothetical protein M3Y97_00674700 [Aphelenchoides bicaudatus]|nr:hypothetical protein M3Y97_00674700 [Aphelenchoides bicaudatus]
MQFDHKDERLPIDNRNAEKQAKSASKKTSHDSDHLVTNKPRALIPADKPELAHLMKNGQHALESPLPNDKPSSSTDKSASLNIDPSAKEDNLIDLNFDSKDAKVFVDLLSSTQSTSTPKNLLANGEAVIPEETKFKSFIGGTKPDFNNVMNDNKPVTLKLPPSTTKTATVGILREVDNISKQASPRSLALNRANYTEAPKTAAPILHMVFGDSYDQLIANNPMSCTGISSTMNNAPTTKEELSKSTSTSDKINSSPENNSSFNTTLSKWQQQEKRLQSYLSIAKSNEATKQKGESIVDRQSKEMFNDSIDIVPVSEDADSKSQKEANKDNSSSYLTSIKGSSTQCKTPASSLSKPADKSSPTTTDKSSPITAKTSDNTLSVFIETEDDLANGWTLVESKKKAEEKEPVLKSNSPNTPSTSSSFENLSPPADNLKSILKPLSSDSTTPNAERLAGKKVDFTPKVKVSGIFVDEPTNHPPVQLQCEPLKRESSRTYEKEKKPSSVEEEWVKRMKTLKRCIDTLKSPNATDVQLGGAMNALEKFYERWSGVQMVPAKPKEEQACAEKNQQHQKMKDMEEQIAELTIKHTKLIDEKLKLQEEYDVQVAICQSYKDQEARSKREKEQINMKEETTQIKKLTAQVKKLADDKEKLLAQQQLLEQQRERERNDAKLAQQQLLEQQRERERNAAKLKEEWLKIEADRELYRKNKQQENKTEQSKPDNAQAQRQAPPTEQAKEQQPKTSKAGQIDTKVPQRSVQTRSMTKKNQTTNENANAKVHSTSQRSNQKTVNPVNDTNVENRAGAKPRYDTSMQPTQVLTSKQNLEQKPSKPPGNEKPQAEISSKSQTPIAVPSHSTKPSYADMAKRFTPKQKPESVFIDVKNDSDYPSIKKS